MIDALARVHADVALDGAACHFGESVIDYCNRQARNDNAQASNPRNRIQSSASKSHIRQAKARELTRVYFYW